MILYDIVKMQITAKHFTDIFTDKNASNCPYSYENEYCYKAKKCTIVTGTLLTYIRKKF